MIAKVVRICFVIGCVGILFVAACKPVVQNDAVLDPATEESVAESPKKTEGTVLATMADGREVVTWEDLDGTYHIERLRRRLDEEQVNRLVENLVKQHLVYLDGIEKGYDKDPEYLKQIERTKRQLINRIAMRKLAEAKVEVSDDEIRAYYDANPDEFNMRVVKYILFSLRKYDNNIEKTKKEAAKALKALKKGMAMDEASVKFLERARPFKLNMRKGQPTFFGNVFDDVVWGLEVGKKSDLIETAQGVIIVEVEANTVQSFEDAKTYIEKELSSDKSKNKLESYYADLKKKYSLQIDQEALLKKLEELKKQSPPGGAPPLPGMPTRPPMPPRPKRTIKRKPPQ